MTPYQLIVPAHHTSWSIGSSALSKRRIGLLTQLAAEVVMLALGASIGYGRQGPYAPAETNARMPLAKPAHKQAPCAEDLEPAHAHLS